MLLICRLLIWEECHYEPSSCSAELEGNWSSDIHSLQLGIQAGDRVHFLINKMMMNNHVNVVGEGYACFFSSLILICFFSKF